MISTTVKLGTGDYLMQLKIGSPPQSFWAVLDTGSDVIWTTCRPCDGCFSDTTSLFEPRQSSTYKNQSCYANRCEALAGKNGSFCDGNSNCGFSCSYEDGSSVTGTLASETLSFDDGAGSAVAISSITFGCVNSENAPEASLLDVPGLVGLGKGPLSLPSQIGSRVDYKFAYCLPPRGDQNFGRLKFGEDAEFSGTGEVQQTSMVQSSETYYIVTLEDISVGNNRLNIRFGGAQTAPILGDARSIVIDSGTTLTYLAKDVTIKWKMQWLMS